MTADTATTADPQPRRDSGRPSVSAIVATRDRPQLLAEAVAAIHAQDYPGVIETVVVFDQSEPDLELASSDPLRPVRVITNTNTPGLPGARNSGLAAATGDTIAFCDDDDAWHPSKVTRQIEALDQDPTAAVVMTGCRICYEDHTIDRVFPEARLRVEDLIESRVQDAHPSSILARRDVVLEHIGIVDEQIPGGYGEDHDWMIRAARHAPIIIVQEPLIDVLWGRHTFFMDRWKTIAEALEYMLAKHPEYADQPRGRANLRGRIAFAHAATGDRGAARRDAFRSLRDYPLDRRAWAALIVGTRLISAERAMNLAHRFGRGI